MYRSYADINYYTEYSNAEIDEKYLKQASREIDVLTFNRIIKKGFENLTKYQQEIIKEVCCEHASFLSENREILKTYLYSYSMNGVSMNFGSSWNVLIESGVAIDRSLYERLCSTGLCCRSFYYG